MHCQAAKSSQTKPTEIHAVAGEVCAVTLVNDASVPHLKAWSAAEFSQVEEYKTDSENSDDVENIRNPQTSLTLTQFAAKFHQRH